MDITRIEAPKDTQAAAFDTLARSLHARLPRRRAARLLAAALTTGVFGISGRGGAEARPRRRSRRTASTSAVTGRATHGRCA